MEETNILSFGAMQ